MYDGTQIIMMDYDNISLSASIIIIIKNLWPIKILSQEFFLRSVFFADVFRLGGDSAKNTHR